MAVANTQSVQGKNASIYVDGINASAYLNEFEIDSSRDDTDVTPFESDDKVIITSAAENDITLTGFWNGDPDSLDDILDETYGGDQDNVITIFPGGVNSGKSCYMVPGTQVSTDVSAASDEEVQLEVEFKSALVRGKVLKGRGAPVTATGQGATPVVAPKATSRGATAAAHVLGVTGNPTEITIEVEQSADGTTWSSLVSMDATAGKGGYVARTLKTDTVEKQLRWKITITGGTSPSVDFVLVCGRRA